MPEPDDKELRQLKAQARGAWRGAHQADARAAEAEARRLEAEARIQYAYGAAAKAHAEQVNLIDAVDELRDVFKRWFLDAHAGLTLRQAMEGIGGDLQRVLALADGGEVAGRGE